MDEKNKMKEKSRTNVQSKSKRQSEPNGKIKSNGQSKLQEQNKSKVQDKSKEEIKHSENTRLSGENRIVLLAVVKEYQAYLDERKERVKRENRANEYLNEDENSELKSRLDECAREAKIMYEKENKVTNEVAEN